LLGIVKIEHGTEEALGIVPSPIADIPGQTKREWHREKSKPGRNDAPQKNGAEAGISNPASCGAQDQKCQPQGPQSGKVPSEAIVGVVTIKPITVLAIPKSIPKPTDRIVDSSVKFFGALADGRLDVELGQPLDGIVHKPLLLA
jgi:hypothetical protein